MYVNCGTFIQRDDGGCIPLDPDNADYVAYVAWVAEGNAAEVPPAPSVEQRIEALRDAITAHLDAAAHAKNYDDIKSAALRAAYPGPYHAEGVAFATWMDTCWATAYALLAQWQAGQLAEPTRAELIAMLPTLVLPS